MLQLHCLKQWLIFCDRVQFHFRWTEAMDYLLILLAIFVRNELLVDGSQIKWNNIELTHQQTQCHFISDAALCHGTSRSIWMLKILVLFRVNEIHWKSSDAVSISILHGSGNKHEWLLSLQSTFTLINLWVGIKIPTYAITWCSRLMFFYQPPQNNFDLRRQTI